MNPILTKNFTAGAAVTGRRFVVPGASDGYAIQASAVTSKIFGISITEGAAIGGRLDVHMIGIADLELGGTVSFGDPLTSDANGKGIELSSTVLSASSARCGGIALQDGVSGDIIKVAIGPQLVSAFDGVTSTVAEIDTLAGAVAGATFTIGAEAANVINVGIQLTDANDDDVAVRSTLYAYLSDDANGDSIVATAPDGGVAIGTDGLADPVTANKSFMLTSESDGDIDINITEAGTKTAYLVLVLPNGKRVVSDAITHAA